MSADEHERVATACRILASEGLVEDILGHISLRVDERTMLIRGRGPHERGLMFTTAEDIRQVGLDGTGEPPDSGYALPNELPIHGALLAARPGVNAVVHAHPRSVLLAGLAGLALRPVYGAYDMVAMRLALAGVPVYPRSVLIRTPELAAEMLAAMGPADVCVLRGHGVTVAGASLEQAVVRAVALHRLAEVTVQLAQLGATPEAVSAADLAQLPDLGSGFNDATMWRHLTAKLAVTEGR
jgi:3,4-dihydroxyphthalate decarboxylase